jgi:hypothetical protein
MHNARPAVERKALNLVQRNRSQLLRESQPEALCDRRVNSIEDGICTCALYPGGPAVRMETTACLSKLYARLSLGTLQSS